MDTRLAERLFVLITSNMDRTYEEECKTAKPYQCISW